MLSKIVKSALWAVGLLCIAFPVRAEIYDVWFGADTRNWWDGSQEVTFWITVKDNQYSNLRDAVESVKVVAPDGTVFDFDLDINYDRTTPNKGFWYSAEKSEFISGDFPSGTYVAKVTDLNTGRVIEKKDSLKIRWLGAPRIKRPKPGAVAGPTPTLRWTSVRGAVRYRITMWDQTWGEPVYSWLNDEQNLYVTGASFKVPLGVLKPGHDYRWRVEARDGPQDTDRRSRSKWEEFRTSNF